MFAHEALFTIHILCVAYWLIKLWSMATPIKLIYLFRAVSPIFGPENPSNNKLIWSGLIIEVGEHYESSASLNFGTRMLIPT